MFKKLCVYYIHMDIRDKYNDNIYIVRNLSVSLSLISIRNEKIKYHIRIKTHKPITLKSWVESDIYALCG